MKPHRIILIRHAESEGNADKNHFRTRGLARTSRQQQTKHNCVDNKRLHSVLLELGKSCKNSIARLSSPPARNLKGRLTIIAGCKFTD